MSKAVVFHKNGGPEELKLENISVREPGEGEAKLRVEAAGLNRAELMYLGGYYLETAKLPSRIGYEVAGVVTAVGAGVDPALVGKRLSTVPGFSMNEFGSLGEEAIVPASRLAVYPEKLTPAEGASIWMQYVTAYGALVWHGKVAKGDFVLITAASSSVGIAAIQIVKAEGGIAIATTRRSDKRDALLAQGADYVIATEEEDLKARVDAITGGKGARIVFDPGRRPVCRKARRGHGSRRHHLRVRRPLPRAHAVPVVPILDEGHPCTGLHAARAHGLAGTSQGSPRLRHGAARRWALPNDYREDLPIRSVP